MTVQILFCTQSARSASRESARTKGSVPSRASVPVSSVNDTDPDEKLQQSIYDDVAKLTSSHELVPSDHPEEKHVEFASNTELIHINAPLAPLESGKVGDDRSRESEDDNDHQEINNNPSIVLNVNTVHTVTVPVPTQPTLRLDDNQAMLYTPNDTLEGISLVPCSFNEDFIGDPTPRVSTNQIHHILDRRSSAVMRHNQHQEENVIIHKALKKANDEKLKTAIKYLVSQHSHPQHRKFSTLQYIAQFLYNNDTLDKEEIGEMLGALDTKTLFTEQQHRQLLMLYVSQLNFTGQSFDTAFRHFLTDSGFRLPKEAQKIERLLMAFSKIFIKHNPHYFDGSDETALLLSYGMLMLNTDLHNPNMKVCCEWKY